MRSFLRDASTTAIVSGILAVVVSYVGSAVIIFHAAKLAGMGDDLTSSWIWAVSIGCGLSGLYLSWRMKVPIVTAWSTPGAALLVVMLPTVGFSEAIGAYIVSAALITLVGVTGSLDWIMHRIPPAVSSGMFAGILFGFGAQVFTSVQIDPLLSLGMIGCFVLFRRVSPRYAIAAVLVTGIALAASMGLMQMGDLEVALATPVFTAPTWSVSTILGVGVPLALVTLTGQYISGMAVLHASGYNVRSNGIMTTTGLASLILAPFGSHAINLASLTAAICTGKDAHDDPSRRYVAGMVCGGLYVLIGLFGTTLTSLFTALPAVFIAVLAGLALIGPFTTGITGLVKDASNLEPGIIAFLATASGMDFLGLSAPFWGLIFGGLSFAFLKVTAFRR